MRYDLTLSPDYVSSWSFKDAIREIFQNALDQQTLDPANEMTSSFAKQLDGTYTLQVQSRKSTLDKSSLLLGHTTKESDSRTIGQFGEGYKLALLVLLRSNHKVTIHNYGALETWTPAFAYSSKYNSTILSINVAKYRLKTVPNYNLIWIIQGISQDDMRSWRDFNLVTNKNYEHIDLEGRQVLTEPRHVNHIYVSGLFVCVSSTPLSYGYNLWPEDVKLDRDRGMVDSFDLLWNLSMLWAKYPTVSTVVKMVEQNANDVKYLDNNSYATPVRQDLTVNFIATHGMSAVPVSTQVQADALKHTGLTTIIVPELVYKLINCNFSMAIARAKPSPLTLLQAFGEDHSACFTKQAKDDFQRLLEASKTWRN